jgi:hypothetical protein
VRITHRKTKPPVHPRVWKPMASVPQDGVWFDLLGSILYITPGKTNPGFDDCLAVVDFIEDGFVAAHVMAPGDFGPQIFRIKLVPPYVVVGRLG